MYLSVTSNQTARNIFIRRLLHSNAQRGRARAILLNENAWMKPCHLRECKITEACLLNLYYSPFYNERIRVKSPQDEKGWTTYSNLS
jgi:hypothetical protein